MRSSFAALALLSLFTGSQAAPLVQREFSGRDNRFIEMPGGAGGAGFRAMAGGKHITFDAQGMSVELPQQAATVARQQAGRDAAARSLGIQPSSRLRYSFEDASVSAPQGMRQSPTVYHWLVGPATEWHTDLKSYGALGYRNVWPGTDAVFMGEASGFKYQFELAPGADPGRVWLRVQGATDARILPNGALEWRLDNESFTDDAPLVYQSRGASRAGVAASYRLERVDATTWRVGFALGDYDRGLPLVIDPAWTGYSGLVGGNSADIVNAVTRDAEANTYACGVTRSADLPRTTGQPYAGNEDAFVVKFNDLGVAQTVTYIGGADDDACRAIALDPSGRIYLAGGTQSIDFPTRGVDSSGAIRGSKAATDRDAFVMRLSGDGAVIDYAGLIGGTGDDQANALAVDWSGRAYLTGFTAGKGFASIAGPSLVHAGGPAGSEELDAFVARVAADGRTLEYAGFIGGDGGAEMGNAIAVDIFGAAYVAGATDSASGLPSAPGLRSVANARDTDASDGFVAKVSADGRSFGYFTLLTGPGAGADRALALSLRQDGSVLVAGETESTSFPANSSGTRVGPGPQNTRGQGMDGFLLQLSPSGTEVWSATYLGGNGYDSVEGVASDNLHAYVTGNTNDGTGFATKLQSGISPTAAGRQDGFIAKMDLGQPSDWVYAGFLGTAANEAFTSMYATVAAGKTIVSVGGATTTPGTAGLAHPTTQALSGNAATANGLVLRIDPFGPPASMVVQSGNAQSTPILSAFATPLSVRVADIDGQPLANIVVTFTAPAATQASTGFATTTTAKTDANGTASLTVAANQFAGAYTVTAQAGATSTAFSLTNDKSPQAPLAVTASTTSLAYGASTTLGTTGGSGTGAVSYAVTAGAAQCTVSGNTLSATAVGDCTVTATKLGDAGYHDTQAVVQISVIKAAQPALAASATPSTLPAFTTATLDTTGGAGSGAVSFAVTGGDAQCAISARVLTAQSAGSCTITATKLGDASYNDAMASTVVTVTQGAQAPLVVQAVLTTVPYGATTTLSTTGGSGTGSISYAVTAGAAICSLASQQLTATAAGSCTVTATKAGDANHVPTSASLAITVSKAVQDTLNVQATPAAIPFGGTAQLGTQGGSGSGAISYATSTPAICQVVNGVVTGLGTGVCVVTATKAGDDNHELATATTSVPVSLAAQSPLVVTATPASIALGASSSLSASGGNGTGALSFAVTAGAGHCTITNDVLSGVGVGPCTVTATKAGDAGYAQTTGTVLVEVTKQAQTIHPTTLRDRVLHPDALPLQASASSNLPVDFSSLSSQTCTVTAGMLRLLTTGQCTVRVSQAGDAQYAAATPLDLSFTISLPQSAFNKITAQLGGGITATAEIAAGSPWVFTPSGSADWTTAGFIPVQGHARSPATPPPANISFPRGLFDFVAMNGTAGSGLTVTLTYSSALPPNPQYWKYGRTPDNSTPHWYHFTGARFSHATNSVTLSLVDGQLGDDALDVDSLIADPGGVAVLAGPAGSPAGIPTLSQWGLWLLSLLVLALAAITAARRPSAR